MVAFESESALAKNAVSEGPEKASINSGEWNKMVIGESPRHEFNASDNSGIARFATSASWIVNWFLLIAKIFCVIVSSSKAVSASLADSAVDIVSQAVLSLAESYMSKHSPDYPVGRSRLEALSVLTCAFIMTMASVEIIQFSIQDLYDGLNGNLPELQVGLDLYLILGIGTFSKLFLFIFCRWSNTFLNSDMLGALAEDHFNDVISNSVAIATAAVAFNVKSVWWLDPAGAILISVVIICRWFGIMMEQVRKIVGHTAPPEFIEQVEELARNHDARLRVDCTRAYHFGARYNVELEIVLPGSMTVMESHDIALALQHKIEELDDVERAFVHVDHLIRDGLEHKVERKLVTGTQLLTQGSNPLHQENIAVQDVPDVLDTSELRSRPNASRTGGAGGQQYDAAGISLSHL